VRDTAREPNMTSTGDQASRWEMPYTVHDVAATMLSGGLSLLVVGDANPFTTHASDLGCAMAAVDDVEHLDDLVDHPFDQIVAVGILDGSVDPAGLLRRVTRHLVPSGRLVVTFRSAAARTDAWSDFEQLLGIVGLSVIDVVDIHRPLSTDMSEWVVLAGHQQTDCTPNLARRLLRDAVELARAREELAAVRESLDDALRLEREVEWLRQIVDTFEERIEAAERNFREAEQAHDNALALAMAAQAETAAIRRRAGYVVIERFARIGRRVRGAVLRRS
jgi:hypothetical protein